MVVQVIEMQLRHQSKQMGMGAAVVSTIENAEKAPKKVKSWVDSISELHSSKPPTEVLYSKPMPDIESLMQVWDPQFEEMLSNTNLPNPSLDLSLDEYVRVVCAMFDIPVYQNSVESLHVLFTLFSEFKNNQHFQQVRSLNAQVVAYPVQLLRCCCLTGHNASERESGCWWIRRGLRYG